MACLHKHFLKDRGWSFLIFGGSLDAPGTHIYVEKTLQSAFFPYFINIFFSEWIYDWTVIFYPTGGPRHMPEEKKATKE